MSDDENGWFVLHGDAVLRLMFERKVQGGSALDRVNGIERGVGGIGVDLVSGSREKDVASRGYFIGLGVLYLAFWVLMAIAPKDRDAWVMENLLVWFFVPMFVVTRRWFVFSRLSYTLIFIGLCLHCIGAHYTYAEVPYDRWSSAWLGFSINDVFGLERNHYDRVIHFGYGLLLSYPLYEVLKRRTGLGWFWSAALASELILSTSALFELLEWLAAVSSGRSLGTDILGMQGDKWDAQKDIALAWCGSLLTMGSVVLVRWTGSAKRAVTGRMRGRAGRGRVGGVGGV